MEDSDIIALYFACAESAVSETVKKYGAYLNAVAYKYPPFARVRQAGSCNGKVPLDMTCALAA